jgi:hypothetical protein
MRFCPVQSPRLTTAPPTGGRQPTRQPRGRVNGPARRPHREIEAENGPAAADAEKEADPVRGIGVVAAAGFVAFVDTQAAGPLGEGVARPADWIPGAGSQFHATRSWISREGSAWDRWAIMGPSVSVLRQRGPRKDCYLTARGRASPVAWRGGQPPGSNAPSSCSAPTTTTPITTPCVVDHEGQVSAPSSPKRQTQG